MTVYIVDREFTHKKRYQIMQKIGMGFDHVFPGKLFDLNTAIKLCGENNYAIAAIGNIWHCINK